MNTIKGLLKKVWKRENLEFENTTIYMNDVYESMAYYYKYKKKNKVYLNFEKSLFDLTILLEALEEEKLEDVYLDYILIGELKALYMLDRYQKMNEMDETLINEFLEKSEYSELILKIIEQNSGISHYNLSKALDVTKSNLSNILSRLEKYRMFYKIPKGRIVNYFLSENGVNALDVIKIRNKWSSEKVENVFYDNYTLLDTIDENYIAISKVNMDEKEYILPNVKKEVLYSIKDI